MKYLLVISKVVPKICARTNSAMMIEGVAAKWQPGLNSQRKYRDMW